VPNSTVQTSATVEATKKTRLANLLFVVDDIFASPPRQSELETSLTSSKNLSS
jgi:hypothetical protein